ncbi:hypothetical protein CJ207_07700, partial [Klebsiella aerogenes]
MQNTVEPDEAPAEDERSYWEKRAGITFTIYKEPDPYFSAGNSSKGNGLTAWFLPELAEGKAAASGRMPIESLHGGCALLLETIAVISA